MIGFIDTSHTPLGTTGNYSAIAIPTLYSSPLHTHLGSQSSLVVPWQRIYNSLTVISNHTWRLLCRISFLPCHFFSITFDCRLSNFMLHLPTAEHNSNSSAPKFISWRLDIQLTLLSLSLVLRPTVSRPVCLGTKRPSGAYDQIFITCVTVTVLFSWIALSDERSGLSFLYVAGSCQRSLSRVRVP
jgi:hypothetical protein